jgi:hypothetical protein
MVVFQFEEEILPFGAEATCNIVPEPLNSGVVYTPYM